MQNLTLFFLITEIWRVFHENYPIFVDGLLGTLQLAAITVLFWYRFRGCHRLS